MTAPRSAVASQARAVAIVCMLVTGISGASSVNTTLALFEIGRTTEALPRGTPGADYLARLIEAQALAMKPDRQARAALLILLAVLMFFTFVCAGRVLRPAGLPREGIRRLLCAAAVVSAVLRTLDGAADAAYSLRLAHLVARLPLTRERLPAEWLAPTSLALSVGQTLLVAGTMAIIAQYFRSARVKAWAALGDETPR